MDQKIDVIKEAKKKLTEDKKPRKTAKPAKVPKHLEEQYKVAEPRPTRR